MKKQFLSLKVFTGTFADNTSELQGSAREVWREQSQSPYIIVKASISRIILHYLEQEIYL